MATAQLGVSLSERLMRQLRAGKTLVLHDVGLGQLGYGNVLNVKPADGAAFQAKVVHMHEGHHPGKVDVTIAI